MSGLKSHSQSMPAGAHTIVDKSQAKRLVTDAASANPDITLASHHPNSDKSVEPFVGLAVLQKGGDLVRFEYQPRPLSDEDVEVDIHFCGICGSDLHTFDAGWGMPRYPQITGHEIVGRVSKVGAKVNRLSVGQIVGVGAEVLACRSCDDCKRGDDAYCNKRTFTYNSNYPDGQWAFGGYQNKVRVHNEWAFVIPEGLDPAAASPLLCAGVTVYAPLRRHIKAGMHVGVVGVGGLGHLALQYASKLGAASVTAISSSARKKDDATKLGATNFLISTDNAAMVAAAQSFDLIIMTANPDSLNLDPFIRLLKTGGILVPVAAPETPFTFGGVNWKRVVIAGSLVGSKWEVQEALDFAAKHGIRAVIEKFPISKASEAVLKMRQNNLKYRAVLELPVA